MVIIGPGFDKHDYYHVHMSGPWLYQHSWCKGLLELSWCYTGPKNFFSLGCYYLAQHLQDNVLEKSIRTEGKYDGKDKKIGYKPV